MMHNAPIPETETPLTFISFKYGDPRYDNELRGYYALRKKVFVDQLNWELETHGECEVDQYDNENAEYVLALRDGKCVGGCRMQATTDTFRWRGQEYSYMLRDAHLGRLPGFPMDVVGEAPTDPKIWELTRVISDRNPIGFRDLMWRVRILLRNRDVEDTMFITRPVIRKLCLLWGYTVQTLGPQLRFGDMPAVAVNCNISEVRKVSVVERDCA